MVYDEGFDFHFGDKDSENFSTYFVFSKYAPNDNSNPNVVSRWSSYCYATLIGWYQEGDMYGCFYGQKKNNNPNEVTNGEASNKQIVVEGSMKSKTFLQLNEKVVLKNTSIQNKYAPNFRFSESKFSEKLELTAEFKDHAKVVERINSENGSWKAANYDEFRGLSIQDLNVIAGRKKSRTGNYFNFNFHEKELTNETEKEEESIFSFFNNNYLNKNKLKKSKELPSEFNWVDYMGAPKSQVKNLIKI
jgi:hypothetical protein